ncbi:MAG TPA: DUF3551 domain-containing protein [Xanthobacteraceae bacterium]|nr:DUF3551 domain-containing protein [Xanthobacteraceae bacterium]
MKPSPTAPKMLAVAGLIAAVMASAVGPVRAENPVQLQIAQSYPWCLLSSAFEGGENCGFATYGQCMASRLGIGGFCQINTRYQTRVSPLPSLPPARKLHQAS